MQYLAWIFVLLIISYSLDLSLRCHEPLINLFPHLHELNLAAAALTHLKISKEHLCNYKAIFNIFLYLMLNKPNYRKSQLNQSLSTHEIPKIKH